MPELDGPLPRVGRPEVPKPLGGVHPLEAVVPFEVVQKVEYTRLGAGDGHCVVVGLKPRVAGRIAAGAAVPGVKAAVVLYMRQLPRLLDRPPQWGATLQLVPLPRPPQPRHRELLPLLQEV